MPLPQGCRIRGAGARHNGWASPDSQSNRCLAMDLAVRWFSANGWKSEYSRFAIESSAWRRRDLHRCFTWTVQTGADEFKHAEAPVMTRFVTRRRIVGGLAALAGTIGAPAVLRAAGARRVVRIGTRER